MHNNNIDLNKIDKKQPKIIKHFKSKYKKKEKPDSEDWLENLKKNAFTLVRWPEDRNGLLFGIVPSVFISDKKIDKGEIIGTCTVFTSGFNRLHNVKFYLKGTRAQCLEKFNILTDCHRQYLNDLNTIRPDCILTDSNYNND